MQITSWANICYQTFTEDKQKKNLNNILQTYTVWLKFQYLNKLALFYSIS